MKTVLFFRRFKGLTGGHVKVWDFFNHVLASGTHTARIVFTADSVWTAENPWAGAREYLVPSRDAVRPDAFFLGALDWQYLTPEERERPPVPVLNLVAGVRHANEGDPRRELLRHRAIRVCVSREVAGAIQEAGPPNGPVVVIPNALDLAALGPPPGDAARGLDLLVVGVKQAQLARRLGARLARRRRCVEVLDRRVPRPQFLDRLRRARVALFLPLEKEGFYLPALEGMALGALVVCPDCVGNRSVCLPEVNCLRPDYTEDALVEAAERALALPAAARARLLAGARETASRHGIEEERRAFLALLADAPRLWAEAWA